MTKSRRFACFYSYESASPSVCYALTFSSENFLFVIQQTFAKGHKDLLFPWAHWVDIKRLRPERARSPGQLRRPGTRTRSRRKSSIPSGRNRCCSFAAPRRRGPPAPRGARSGRPRSTDTSTGLYRTWKDRAFVRSTVVRRTGSTVSGWLAKESVLRVRVYLPSSPRHRWSD